MMHYNAHYLLFRRSSLDSQIIYFQIEKRSLVLKANTLSSVFQNFAAYLTFLFNFKIRISLYYILLKAVDF